MPKACELDPRRPGDTARVIAELANRGRAHVLGWSMGNFIAQELALRHPQRVRRLILAASDPGGPKAIELKLYKNSGHAFLFQFHDRVSKRVLRFLGR